MFCNSKISWRNVTVFLSNQVANSCRVDTKGNKKLSFSSQLFLKAENL